MKIRNRSATRRTSTPFAQVLACVLLIGIVYPASFGVLHSHGHISSARRTHLSADSAKQISAPTGTPLQSGSDGQDCLVCVLHRQFSGSTVNGPLFIAGLSDPIALFTTPTFDYHLISIISRPIARLSGRAPPLCQA